MAHAERLNPSPQPEFRLDLTRDEAIFLINLLADFTIGGVMNVPPVIHYGPNGDDGKYRLSTTGRQNACEVFDALIGIANGELDTDSGWDDNFETDG